MLEPLPHAHVIDGQVFWRGTNPHFTYLDLETAERLAPRLTGEIAPLKPDLIAAIAEAKAYRRRTLSSTRAGSAVVALPEGGQ